jgi:hypothetical protein
MRYDMAKIIVERPRCGGGAKYPRAARRSDNRRPLEDLPRRVSAKRPWQVEGRGQKYLNENLAPLRRYLRSQVGRPWDKVYSDIRERINPDSAVQLHIWQHLSDYVCTDPHVIRGDVSYRGGPFGRGRDFYVDPRSGLLRASPSRRWKAERRERDEAAVSADGLRFVDAGPDRCYWLLNEIWFDVTLATVPPNGTVWDVVLRREVAVTTERCAFRTHHGRVVYAVAKRQLNKREIRRLRLTVPEPATEIVYSGTMTASLTDPPR